MVEYDCWLVGWIPAWISCHIHLNSLIWFMFSWDGGIHGYYIHKAITLWFPPGSVYLILLSCLLMLWFSSKKAVFCFLVIRNVSFPELKMCKVHERNWFPLWFFLSWCSLHAMLFKSFLKVRGWMTTCLNEGKETMLPLQEQKLPVHVVAYAKYLRELYD